MKSTKLHLYMTGFGPFKTITENPSATVGAAVFMQMSKDSSLDVHYEELAVDSDAVSTYFTNLEETLSQQIDHNNDDRVLLVHIGVHSKETDGQMRLEVLAYNELEENPIVASLPMDVCIESAFSRDGSSAAAATTALLERLNAAIPPVEKTEADDANGECERKRSKWIISRDAGRYYCNCALYRSLKLQERWSGRVFSVFLHIVVPLLHGHPSLEEQTAQVFSLVSGLVQIVKEQMK